MALRPLVALLSLVVALLAASPAQAIVSGRAVTTGQDSYPWQTAVVTSSSTVDDEQWLCGGTLVAADLVLTAAHCIVEDDGRLALPEDIYVLNGSTVLNDSEASDGRWMTFTRVADVALYPGVDLSGAVPRGDLALLRLAAAPPDGRPLRVVDDSQIGWWEPGKRLRIIGWGVTAPGSTTPVSTLRWASVFRQADEACAGAHGPNFDIATMFCALGQPLPEAPDGPVADTCQGDSGGPIMASLTEPTEPTQPANPDAWALIGVTSWGVSCGDPALPGVYARLGDPLLRAFATDPEPTWAPVNVSAPAMPAAATVGEAVTCTPGAWLGEDLAFRYEFHRLGANGTTTLVQSSASNTYVAGPADGSGLICIEFASNAGGTRWAQSPSSTPVAPATVPPAQVPGVEIPRTPPPAAVSQPIAARRTDTAAPRASRLRVRCTRSRRCTATVRVTDPAPSAGIRRVTGTVTYRKACRRKGRRTTCTRIRRVSAKQTAGTTWRLSLGRLPRGRATVTIVAVDRSGRTQRTPAKRTFRVR